LKIRKIFSGRKKNPRTFFFEKYGHTISRKTKSYPSIQKPGQTLPKAILSDVNSIVGNQGHLQAVSLKKPPEICIKKVTHRTPLNCRIKSRLNRLFWRDNPLKPLFLAVDTVLTKTRKPVRKKSIGPRIAPGIPHV